jgi:hypothetical protein
MDSIYVNNAGISEIKPPLPLLPLSPHHPLLLLLFLLLLSTFLSLVMINEWP